MTLDGPVVQVEIGFVRVHASYAAFVTSAAVCVPVVKLNTAYIIPTHVIFRYKLSLSRKLDKNTQNLLLMKLKMAGKKIT